MLNILRKRLLDWYDENKRDLPWRNSRDPYKIWLSEIVLQQTRVDQGLPYYMAFVEKYPSVEALSAASVDDVMRLWQGLGYYTRARKMHQCAQLVTSDFAGLFPNTAKELQKLPGIGPYTAAAIASMAYDEAVPVIDGNVYRVLSRMYDMDVDISASTSYRVFFEVANELLPISSPGHFNQALMEFGALYCTPKSPRCGQCPFADICKANINATVAQRPVNLKKKKVKDRHFNYVVFVFGSNVLVQKRQQKDIWQGLYEYYLIEGNVDEAKVFDAIMERIDHQVQFENDEINVSHTFKHLLTHQRLFVKFITIYLKDYRNFEIIRECTGCTEIDFEGFKKLGKPIIIEKHLTMRS